MRKYAEFVGVSFENLVTTNGSDMAIRYLLETFGEQGKEVVTVAPSFEMYWVNCNILGLKHVPVSYDTDFTINVDNIIGAISEDTRVVVLLNPNNPMGDAYTEEEFVRILNKTKEVGAILIVDEAYHYFYENTFLKYALEEENVVILRTFSKLFSLAACRLGVVIANPQIIHYIKNVKLTFDANAIALLFAERIIEHPEIIASLIQNEAEGKAYAIAELEAKGYECRSCKGNFFFIKPKHPAKEVAKRLEEERKVLVHAYGNPILQDYIRVSVGSVAAMKIFLEHFLAVDGE